MLAFPRSEAIIAVYPNPVRSEVIVEYSLSKETPVTISLVDIQGKLVKNYYSGKIRYIGRHAETLYLPDNIPSGNYFLVLGLKDETRVLMVVND